jgi:uncharacterized protein (TIGR03118 family)
MKRHFIGALAFTLAGFSCTSGSNTGSEQTSFNGNTADAGEGGADAAKADAGACVCADAGVDAGSGIAAVVTRTDVLTDAKDPNLVNAWGLAFNETAGPAWISNNGTGTSTVVDATGKVQLTVKLPKPTGADNAAPTGIVFNKSADAFKGDTFVFVTEDGSVAGWQRSGSATGTDATMRVDASTAAAGAAAIYKGATIAGVAGSEQLYATDFHNGKIDVFDRNYQPVKLGTNAFTDPNMTAGFAPFNIDAIGNMLLVTYAKQDEQKKDDQKGAGNGFVDVFDMSGNLLSRLASNGSLNSPWGMAVTPDEYGAIPHRLLIGNFGDGTIHVYDVTLSQTGLRASFEGQLGGADGKPLVIDGLWALRFPTGPMFDKSQLYFTAGPGDEMHGAYGRLELRK